jgi:hypothetical protein
MIEILPPLGKYKYDTLKRLLVKCYIDNSVRLWSCIRNVNSDVESRHLQGCSPRLCQLRTDGLVPMSKYWTYWSLAGDVGPVSLVAYHQQVLGLSVVLRWLWWKRNWNVSRRPLSRVERWSQEHFFLRAVHLSKLVDDSWKGCYTWTTWDTYDRGIYTDQAWNACGVLIKFSLQGVHWFESSWLSDLSNRLFVAVFT